MPTLHIRNLPKKLYEQLILLAKSSGRSLTQEAIVQLEKGIEVSLSERIILKNKTLQKMLDKTGKEGLFNSDLAIKWIRKYRDMSLVIMMLCI